MTILPRLAHTLHRAGRRSRARLAISSLAALAMLVIAAPAGAVVKSVEVAPGEHTTVGLEGHSTVLFQPASEPAAFENEHGNPVLHQSATYAIYWDPNALYHGDWHEVINGFLMNAGAASGNLASVFAVDAQYTDKTNVPASYRNSFRGAFTDKAVYPVAGCTDPHPMESVDRVTCLTDKQVRAELEHFVAANGLPKGLGTIYYILTPPGVAVCLDGGATASHCSSNNVSANSFCSYHSDINPGGLISGDANTILYATVPWVAGGVGDPQLGPTDKLSSTDCQDGGYDPTSKPNAETREKAKEKTKKEIEAFEEAPAEQKAAMKRAEELEGPHLQEPNQVLCPSVFDGGCDTGLADVIVNQVGSEQQNIVTNPMLNAWQDPKGNEVTDECRNWFALSTSGASAANELSQAGSLANQELATGRYYLNDAFNLAAMRLNYPGVGCLNHVNLVPSFNLVTPVNSGEVVGFDGMQSNIALDAGTRFSATGAPEANYATYTWNFGDGSPEVSGYAPGAPACEPPALSPCAASEFHSYTYGGEYTVTLTVKDVGGFVAKLAQKITVVGPPPPPPPAPPSSGGGSPAGPAGPAATAGTTATGTPGPGAGAGAAVPNPLATAAIVSRSLKTAARKGLVVRYSVNEQVAGRFEVLVPASVAKRLGISGTPATSMPAGAPAQLVVARSVLITTKAGRSTVTIPFTRRTSGRLGRGRKLTLTLRMFVRNAASHSPASTTVVTAATLTH